MQKGKDLNEEAANFDTLKASILNIEEYYTDMSI